MMLKNRYLLAWLCLQLPVVGCAGTLGPTAAVQKSGSGGGVAKAPLQDSARPTLAVQGASEHASPCAERTSSVHRTVKPQGTMLWGTRRDWDSEKKTEENASVLVSVGLTSLARAEAPARTLRLEGGQLVDPSAPASPEGGGLRGTVLQGLASDGSQVEVAICGAEPSERDSHLVQYDIQVWNTLAQQWENPCVALSGPAPGALAVGGVWDSSGAHHDTPDRFTFACENGVITKCIHFGYKPWDQQGGHSLADVHQACTRMARADYCGDGHTHTHNGTLFDYYDRFGVVARTDKSSDEWDLKRASFEAAWAPDGATSLAHTRDGRPLESVLQECPGRFHTGQSALELGGEDRARAWRTDMNPADSVLRDWSYGSMSSSASAVAHHP